ncbi:MAG: efflux RND transporter periplasmic adaptor subunit [Bacteroidetes bacterium]|nr:efflux RND transporter periplasmic adaptor subunit [Bacteroidota bacterium]MCY4204262.1 efflux RND transporter periplasmic adaptor subunit [Bacteroidota bacterium]
MSNHKTLTLLLITTVFSLVVGVGCSNQEATTNFEIRPVRYAEAVLAGGDQIRTFPGVARAASEQNLSFRVGGTITSVDVNVGSIVRKGQILMRLDSGDLKLRKQQAEAGLAQARAQSRNAKANYERVVALYENGNASMSEMDAARASFESANASEVSSETALSLAEQQVVYAQLRAPVTGSISQVTVDVNEAVGVGQTVVVIIDTDGNPEVQITVPEVFISGLREERPAQVVFGALGDEIFNALVTEVGTAATSAGGFPVIVRLDQGPRLAQIRPGMAAEVTFIIEGISETTGVLVPPQAVGQDHLGRFVYVLNRTDTESVATAERRSVETGALTPAGLEIINGISDGEFVATAGIKTLVSGQQVRFLRTD